MPPMPTSSQRGGMRGPSAFDKWKMGAMMGGSVGLIMGFLFGGFSIMRYGAGSQGPMRMLAQYMVGSGVTFGFFMSIGSVIRTEAHPNFRYSPSSVAAYNAFARAKRDPIIMPRDDLERRRR